MQDAYMLTLSEPIALMAQPDKKTHNLLQTTHIQALNLSDSAALLVQLGLTNESGTRVHMVNVPALLIKPFQQVTVYDFQRHTELEREDADFEDLVYTIEKTKELHILKARFATSQGMVTAEQALQIQFTPNGFILNAKLPQTSKPKSVNPVDPNSLKLPGS